MIPWFLAIEDITPSNKVKRKNVPSFSAITQFRDGRLILSSEFCEILTNYVLFSTCLSLLINSSWVFMGGWGFTQQTAADHAKVVWKCSAVSLSSNQRLSYERWTAFTNRFTNKPCGSSATPPTVCCCSRTQRDVLRRGRGCVWGAGKRVSYFFYLIILSFF